MPLARSRSRQPAFVTARVRAAPDRVGFDGRPASAIHESLRVSAREALDEAGRWIPNTIEVKKALLDGPINETLAREATERDLDLLVVGSRGFGPLRRVLLRSVSAKLMHDAPCARIVVPRGVPAQVAQSANEVGVVDAG